MKPVTLATLDPAYLDLLRALPEVPRELERAGYISRRFEASARRREAMLCQTPEVIHLPPEPCTERLALEEYVPPNMAAPIPGLVTTDDGRIGYEFLVEKGEARPLVELEEDLFTKDLKTAEERLLDHDREYNQLYIYSCLDAYRTKAREFYSQNSAMKPATWTKVSALELGVSTGDFYKRL